MCKACIQLIHLFRDLNEREFPKLSCDFYHQSPPLLSYNCFYAPRSIIWNRYIQRRVTWDFPPLAQLPPPLRIPDGNRFPQAPLKFSMLHACMKHCVKGAW